MIVDQKIIEALISLLSGLDCGQQAGHLTAGLIYSYLVMQLQAQTQEGIDDNNRTNQDNA